MSTHLFLFISTFWCFIDCTQKLIFPKAPSPATKVQQPLDSFEYVYLVLFCICGICISDIFILWLGYFALLVCAINKYNACCCLFSNYSVTLTHVIV